VREKCARRNFAFLHWGEMSGKRGQSPGSRAAFEKHCRPRQWKKGQSGNPSGRTKGTFRHQLNEILRQVAEEKVHDERFPGKKLKTNMEMLVRDAFEQARRGNFQYWNAIMERIGGKPISQIELTGLDGGPIQHRVEYEPLLDDEANGDDS